jgi:hypothetical protein
MEVSFVIIHYGRLQNIVTMFLHPTLSRSRACFSMDQVLATFLLWPMGCWQTQCHRDLKSTFISGFTFLLLCHYVNKCRLASWKIRDPWSKTLAVPAIPAGATGIEWSHAGPLSYSWELPGLKHCPANQQNHGNQCLLELWSSYLYLPSSWDYRFDQLCTVWCILC